MGFRARDLARLQAHAESFMTSSGFVMSQTAGGGVTLNGAGGLTSSRAGGWQTTGSAIKCRFVSKGRVPKTMLAGGVAQTDELYELFLPLGTAVSAGKRFQVQGGGAPIFDILSVDMGRTYAAQITCECVLAS